MPQPTTSRRSFLQHAGLATGGLLMGAVSRAPAADASQGKFHLACNHYPWLKYYHREGRDFDAQLDAGLAEVVQSGFDGFEPLIGAPEELDRLGPLLKKHKLEMRSLYVNSTLHELDAFGESLERLLTIAAKAQTFGTRILVTNPSPIQWGGPQNKDDDQLRFQALALSRLGRELRELGMVLSYHNHDIELRNAGREFHHMMLGTDPDTVTLCLDAHWIYRGSGNSSVALFDVLKLYGPRISELHLRQSQEGTWSETFGPGDIDYPAMAAHFQEIGVKPHVVLEQAPEKETPKTMGTVEAMKQSADYARKVFAAFGD